MNLGCRTAVHPSPWDMSCGWDEHTHEHGSRLLPGDAIRLGINLVSYVAALRQVAEAQAVTREISAQTDRPRQQFVLAQLRHQGDWNPDPNSTVQMLRHLAGESSLAVGFDLKYVDPKETQDRAVPVPVHDRLPRSAADRTTRSARCAGTCRRAASCSSTTAPATTPSTAHVRAAGRPAVPRPEAGAGRRRTTRCSSRSTRITRRQGPAERRGRGRSSWKASRIKNRLVLVYSKNDMVTHLKQVSDPFGNGYDADTCRKLAVNIVAYALQN